MMNQQQDFCLQVVRKGHNVCILGQAGTGKSFAVKKIVQSMSHTKNIALTCYTGVACLQFKDLRPMTLHRFAGMEDGRHSKDRLLHLLQTDEKFESTLIRIKTTDLLIIDEVSMVTSKVFGGMQVVLSGDFYQLSPVNDELHADNGDPCFKTSFFPDYFKHKIVLKEIFRQTEKNLIKAIHELEMGEPSSETNDFIKSLSRPFPNSVDHQNIVKVQARNLDVDIINYEQLTTLTDDLHVFESTDKGDIYYLNKMLVQKRLGVKVNAKVMLLRNVDEQFVNGSIGTVVEVTTNYISVNFDGTILKIGRFTFSKFDQESGIALATRHQFPLKLAYAITIHKSQGMSLPLVQVDCKNATNAGQIGVAIGRAVTSSGLRVLNYSPKLIRKHPKCIYDFYNCVTSETEVPDSIACCKTNHPCEVEEIEEVQTDTDSEEELVSDLTESNNYFTIDHNYSSGGHASMRMDFHTATQEYLGTPSEEQAIYAYNQLLKSPLTLPWYTKQLTLIQNIYKTCFVAEAGKYLQRHFNEFLSSFQEHVSSQSYIKDLQAFNIQFSSDILSSVMFVIASNFMLKAAELAPPETDLLFPIPIYPESDAGRGKIRYVGGYCIAKCRFHLCCRLKDNLYKPGMEAKVKVIKEQLKILDNVIVTQHEITQTSQYKETLKETKRKQNDREGLINITDESFLFFEKLQESTSKCLRNNALYEQRNFCTDMYLIM